MNHSEPLISVVLPTYNGARHLEETIRSCLDQTWSNLELIIVDDSSTDRTPAIIQRLAAGDERVRPFRHDTNRKLPAALNSGFAQAQGGYCTWISDDNLYRPQALETLVTFLKKNEDVDVIYSGYSRIDEAGLPFSPGLMFAPEYLGYRGNVISPCFLFRRNVYEGVNGYAEDLFLAEDYFFWLCAAAKFNFASLPEDLYFYREHSGSLSSQQTDAVLRVTITALEKALDRTERSPRSLRAGIMIHCTALWFHFKESNRARRAFLSAFLSAPLPVLLRTRKGLFAKLLFGQSAARLWPRWRSDASAKPNTGEADSVQGNVRHFSSER
jgi:glycosyltransferase involved in cell wall biosynthesis